MSIRAQVYTINSLFSQKKQNLTIVLFSFSNSEDVAVTLQQCKQLSSSNSCKTAVFRWWTLKILKTLHVSHLSAHLGLLKGNLCFRLLLLEFIFYPPVVKFIYRRCINRSVLFGIHSYKLGLTQWVHLADTDNSRRHQAGQKERSIYDKKGRNNVKPNLVHLSFVTAINWSRWRKSVYKACFLRCEKSKEKSPY